MRLLRNDMTLAIIAARGGSKAIPRKNLINFCGYPLIAWTIQLAQEFAEAVIVSSDDDEILSVSENFGAIASKRPASISGDYASSESAWMDCLQQGGYSGDNIAVALQVTSPLRNLHDIIHGIRIVDSGECDSVFSARSVDDMLLWRLNSDGLVEEINFSNDKRLMRQTKTSQVFQENGSFYIFRCSGLCSARCRLHGKIGFVSQSNLYSEQIDTYQDLSLLEAMYKSQPHMFYTPN